VGTIGKVNIIDMLGRQIYSEQINGISGIIDLSSKPAGVYVVQYTESDSLKAKKVIIQ